ncbi:hypothetical protein RCIA105 [Methanocella arvoryzae MRE50]|uniref:Uncharacterized protein n=1 Tax=Methanocella arvoryzae (strain DSM 22066 / NBRC 105507 / MRE50) TaxID=351160 RepID=Q0W4K1_METAR|nr:hypothetical protein RCIA105 [Methanocella arvoryzae MRE50]
MRSSVICAIGRNLWILFQSVASVRFCTAQRSSCCLTEPGQSKNAQRSVRPRSRAQGQPLRSHPRNSF